MQAKISYKPKFVPYLSNKKIRTIFFYKFNM
jgi:hypothetical protein